MSEIETKTIGQLPPLPGPLDGTELLEVERPDQASYHAPVAGLIDLALGGPVADALDAAERAEASATAATGAEATAMEARDLAVAAADAASTSATSAGDSASAASGAADSATASAATATGAAGVATGAASTASSAADTATGAATAASGSASAAAASESAAAGSATAAAGSATAAAGSATAAGAARAGAEAARDEAVASASSAAESANTALIAGREFGVLVARDAGIVTGGYPATRSAWGAMTMSRFFAEAIGGAATVTVRVNDAVVHGPVAVATGQRITQTVSIVLAQGDTVTFDILGQGAKRLWAQIDGGAA